MVRVYAIEAVRGVAIALCIGVVIVAAQAACQVSRDMRVANATVKGYRATDAIARLIEAPTDANCEDFDARFGDGAAMRVLSGMSSNK